MKNKKIILVSVLMTLLNLSFASTGEEGTTSNPNCDSNCLSGMNMSVSNNSTTGTQTTTTKGFSYYTGNSCSGYNLMNNFSDGTQTLRESLSGSCGWPPPPEPVADTSSGGVSTTDPSTGVVTVTTTDPSTGLVTVAISDPSTGTTTTTTTNPVTGGVVATNSSPTYVGYGNEGGSWTYCTSNCSSAGQVMSYADAIANGYTWSSYVLPDSMNLGNGTYIPGEAVDSGNLMVVVTGTTGVGPANTQ
jgi:hypothetical protein